MRRAYTFRRSLEEFAAAREQFNSLVNRLQSEETAWMEHGEVEALVATEGMELLRCLLQGHLDLRAVRESKREAVMGADGVRRSHCRRACERPLMTLFGEVRVE